MAQHTFDCYDSFDLFDSFIKCYRELPDSITIFISASHSASQVGWVSSNAILAHLTAGMSSQCLVESISTKDAHVPLQDAGSVLGQIDRHH